MGRRTVPLVAKKDDGTKTLWLVGARFDIPLGPGWLAPTGERVDVVCIGYHERLVIGSIHPKALELKSDDVTSVRYRIS